MYELSDHAFRHSIRNNVLWMLAAIMDANVVEVLTVIECWRVPSVENRD